MPDAQGRLRYSRSEALQVGLLKGSNQLSQLSAWAKIPLKPLMIVSPDLARGVVLRAPAPKVATGMGDVTQLSRERM
eukprot:4456887-Amphidinium_carterae.2